MRQGLWWRWPKHVVIVQPIKYDPTTVVFLTDPPTHICVKHNGDEKPEDEHIWNRGCVPYISYSIFYYLHYIKHHIKYYSILISWRWRKQEPIPICKFKPSGMLCCVKWYIVINSSNKCNASVFRTKRNTDPENGGKLC